jgi:hypothetical protein
VAERKASWPWGEDRPGSTEWRRTVSAPEKAERQFEQEVTFVLQRRIERGEVSALEEVRLHGSFPLTQLVIVFRLEPRFRGNRLGYADWLWSDGDAQQLYLPQFDSALNTFAQTRRAEELEPGPDGIVWLTQPPPTD